MCWGVWTSEPHCSLDVKVEIQMKTKAFSGPSVPLDGCFGHSTFFCEPCWNIKEPFWAASGVRWPWTQGGGQCGHHQGLLKPSAAVPPRGLAWEELSRSGHLGTSYWPECPAPHPHRFSSFLPFSFLINHTLLPNLNMEIPRLRLCNYS